MIDFLKYRLVCAFLSIGFLLAGVGTYFYKLYTTGQTFTYSVDFTGGTQVLFKFENPVTGAQLREALDASGWPGAVTREFSADELLVRVKEFSNDSRGLAERMKTSIEAKIPNNPAQILQSESVGGGIGQSLRFKSLMAVLIALLAILFYIAVRTWSVAFAVGAVVALIHDPLAILTVFLMLDREISITLIGAILAVLGYSINDTIVIYARIRENLAKMKHESLYEIVNVSLNKTLRRTTLTSLSTAITVTAMLVIGGEALRDFSLALLIGIIVGTYSSIYIASPVFMWLYKENH